MRLSNGQGDLFPKDNFFSNPISNNQTNLKIKRNTIIEWQRKIHNYQSNLNPEKDTLSIQGSIFNEFQNDPLDSFNPLRLAPLPLNFWKWPKSPYQGAAIYFVMDSPKELTSQILLYIGETICADKRWKGEHDCKTYLSLYEEALSFAGIQKQLSIRFWNDVPKSTKERRSIEQKLIRRWIPPFNKETREYWSTPFTSELT